MKYYLTLERTQRISMEIEANDKNTAEHIADSTLDDFMKHEEKFDGGHEEFNCAMEDETGRTVIFWA